MSPVKKADWCQTDVVLQDERCPALIDVKFWGEQQVNINKGDKVTITNLITEEYQDKVQCKATDMTSIEVMV